MIHSVINKLFDDFLHSLNKDYASDMDFYHIIKYAQTDYPSMLEMVPDNRVKNALAENASQIKELAEIYKCINKFSLTKEERTEMEQQKMERIKELVTDLKYKFKDVDCKGVVNRYRAETVKKIGENFLADYTKKFNQFFEKYSALDSVPAGWMRFIQKFHTVITTEVLPELLRKL